MAGDMILFRYHNRIWTCVISSHLTSHRHTHWYQRARRSRSPHRSRARDIFPDPYLHVHAYMCTYIVTLHFIQDGTVHWSLHMSSGHICHYFSCTRERQDLQLDLQHTWSKDLRYKALLILVCSLYSSTSFCWPHVERFELMTSRAESKHLSSELEGGGDHTGTEKRLYMCNTLCAICAWNHACEWCHPVWIHRIQDPAEKSCTLISQMWWCHGSCEFTCMYDIILSMIS